jgi:hypothetical protein
MRIFQDQFKEVATFLYINIISRLQQVFAFYQNYISRTGGESFLHTKKAGKPKV